MRVPQRPLMGRANISLLQFNRKFFTFEITHHHLSLMHPSQLIFKWWKKIISPDITYKTRTILTDKVIQINKTTKIPTRLVTHKIVNSSNMQMVVDLRIIKMVESSSFPSKEEHAVSQSQNKKQRSRSSLNSPAPRGLQFQVSELRPQGQQTNRIPNYKRSRPPRPGKTQEETALSLPRSTLW